MINDKSVHEARESLKNFLNLVLSLIKHLVSEGIDEEGKSFFIPDLHDEIRAAWEEFLKDFSLDHAFTLIQNTSTERLQASGLYGRQLNLKLSVVNKWMERFSKKRLKKILLRLLDAIDTLLDSLIAATGINEALKEIKEILRNSIDED
jgi:hypothetical protein